MGRNATIASTSNVLFIGRARQESGPTGAAEARYVQKFVLRQALVRNVRYNSHRQLRIVR
jgi:hypothetical protein